MKWYFESFGDHVPNSEEIHLENFEVTKIWEEYYSDLKEGSVTYGHFVYIWHESCPCVNLTEARRATRDKTSKTYHTTLHALHWAIITSSIFKGY